MKPLVSVTSVRPQTAGYSVTAHSIPNTRQAEARSLSRAKPVLVVSLAEPSKRAIFLLIALCSVAWSTDLKSATEWFSKGNSAYEEGRFDESVSHYQKAVDMGVADSRLYYNLGNALFRLNRLGPAILYYSRASKLAPTDPDIVFNLRYARAQVVDKVAETDPNLLTRLLWKMHTGIPLRGGLWLVLALFSLGFFGAGTSLFVRSPLLRVSAWLTAGAALACLLALSPSLFYKIRQTETTQAGIVLAATVEMFSGPGESYQLLAKVHEGTEFEIVEQRGEWLSVKLRNGKGGFVRSKDLGKV